MTRRQSDSWHQSNQCNAAATQLLAPGTAVTYPTPLTLLPSADTQPSSCEHGPAIVDECNTVCRCIQGHGGYACGRRGCSRGLISGKPQRCPEQLRDIPRTGKLRVFCHDGIIKAQPKGELTQAWISYWLPVVNWYMIQ